MWVNELRYEFACEYNIVNCINVSCQLWAIVGLYFRTAKVKERFKEFGQQ